MNYKEIEEIATRLKSRAYYMAGYTPEQRNSYIKGIDHLLGSIIDLKSWENPYTKAIAHLERAARAFEGSYG